MRHEDKRLPAEHYVFENSAGEFVVSHNERVVEVSDGTQRPWNVKAGKSVEEAVQYFLSKVQA